MRVTLTVTAGPHEGKAFTFDGHDTFLVGRSKDAHFHLPRDDPYFSRRHFLIDVNPPRCRLLDLASRNGTHVNGTKVKAADLQDGDAIKAGHTVLQVTLQPDPTEKTLIQPLPIGRVDARAPLLDLIGPPVAPAGLPTIPGYRVEQELGRGGMGVVYRAVREADGAAVAIKTITPAVAGRPSQVERFLREARILEELCHPHIVAFHAMGESNGLLYFVMDYIRGTDAAKLVRRGPLAIPVAVRMTCQLLEALEYAHEKGFVHRDIKPANLLIEQRGRKRSVKLADFGLARVYGASKLSGPTLQGEMCGTPCFMAPEQVTHYRDAKPPADQYSTAATLYNLLTGRHPHESDADMALLLVRIVTEPPIPLRAQRPEVPEELAAVLHRALAREPEDRFADVKAFRLALRPFTATRSC